MKCPKCAGEMSTGFLYADNVITWAPKLHPFGLSIWNKDAINVSTLKYMQTQYIPVISAKPAARYWLTIARKSKSKYYCRKCCDKEYRNQRTPGA